MHAETRGAGLTRKSRVVRFDGERLWLPIPGISSWMAPVLAVMAIAFVLVGAGNLDVGAADARLGLAAGESIRAVSQVYGYYAPDLWPGRVAVSAFAGMFEEGKRASGASVLWPAALAAVAIGWMLARRLAQTVGPRAGFLFGLSWFGCLGVIDHSGALGLEFLAGLATIGALDRLLTHGSDWTAGVWTALTFLAGGWPPVLLICLAVIVVGRGGASFSPRLLLPPLAAFAGWSAWALASESAEAWAATLTWPLTQRPDWWLIPGVLGVGIPCSPFAFLALSRRLREGLSPIARVCVLGWFQVAVACLIAGTVIPGLAQAARIPALAGILLISSVALDAAWSQTLSRSARKFFLVLTFGLLAVWLITLLYGGYLWTLVLPYYRPLGITVLLLGIPALILGWWASESGKSRRAVIALVVLTISIKLVHFGYYVPEWNYRHGQGPWGRAIGQWLLPNWTVHTFHEWPTDLALAIGRPVLMLRSAEHLAYPATPEAKHVLLLESEFLHWPEQAPKVYKIAELQDVFGAKRILARTQGKLTSPSGIALPIDDNQ
jgi:hypothetical protein